MRSKVDLEMNMNVEFNGLIEEGLLTKEDVRLMRELVKDVTFGDNRVNILPLSDLEQRTGIKNIEKNIGRLVDNYLIAREGNDYYMIADLEVRFPRFNGEIPESILLED